MEQTATFVTTFPTSVTSINAATKCLKVKSQLFIVKPRIALHSLRMMIVNVVHHCIAKFTASLLQTSSGNWNKNSLSVFSVRPHKICKMRRRIIAVRHL